MTTITKRGDALFEFEGAKGRACAERSKTGEWRVYLWRAATPAEAEAMGWPEGHEHFAHVDAPDGVLDFGSEAAAVSAATTLAGE